MIRTFLSKSQLENFTKVSNEELDKLFQEVRSKIPEYHLQETAIKIERPFFTSWFKKFQTEKIIYTLYNSLGDEEVQIINFDMDCGSSINTSVPKPYIMAYFFGVLTGCDSIKH